MPANEVMLLQQAIPQCLTLTSHPILTQYTIYMYTHTHTCIYIYMIARQIQITNPLFPPEPHECSKTYKYLSATYQIQSFKMLSQTMKVQPKVDRIIELQTYTSVKNRIQKINSISSNRMQSNQIHLGVQISKLQTELQQQ